MTSSDLERIVVVGTSCSGKTTYAKRLAASLGHNLLLWVITTYERRKKSFAQLRASNVFNHLQWVEFRTPREAEQFLRHGHTIPMR